MWARVLFFSSSLCLVGLPLYTVLSGQAPLGRDYRTADRSSARIAPLAETTPEPVVQVYAARALNRRGALRLHTSPATTHQDAQDETAHPQTGCRRYRNWPAR